MFILNKFYVIIVIFLFYVYILSPLSSSTDLIDLLMILLFYGINVERRTDLMLVAEGEERRPFHFDLNKDIRRYKDYIFGTNISISK